MTTHHDEGEHDEQGVGTPTVPGAGFVVIVAEFVLGNLEAVRDGVHMQPRGAAT
jgi:hypothetical protein